jgi:DNA end-binding protein Ku
MARIIWKGAISFGLVHIPVSLVAATAPQGIDFDWLDRRTLEPVGYKRVNKATGEEIDNRDIVRGVQYEKGRYVVLSDDEIRAAYPKATQTVDIQAFVRAEQIPFLYLDTPYYLVPDPRGGKAYALLRRVLEESGRLALASVVLHTRQRLAVLVPFGRVLVLDTLRWSDEVKAAEAAGAAGLPAETGAPVGRRELDMARHLVEDMSEDWDPAAYTDRFAAQIMALVERKARSGQVAEVAPVEAAEEGGAEIIDLAELLRRSLGKPPPKRPARGEGKPSSPRSPRRAGGKAA